MRWTDYLDKGEMLTNRDVNKFVRNKLFVRMEHFCDFLFQLRTKTLQVAFIFVFSTCGLDICAGMQVIIRNAQLDVQDSLGYIFPNR